MTLLYQEIADAYSFFFKAAFLMGPTAKPCKKCPRKQGQQQGNLPKVRTRNAPGSTAGTRLTRKDVCAKPGSARTSHVCPASAPF